MVDIKTKRNILIAFLLNLFFSVFEFVGGIYTGSTAIMSDSIHDIGDAFSIGISYLLENKSTQKPNEKYTYGYSRYSIIGALFTSIILLISSTVILFNSITKIIVPTNINYDGMLIFAIIGVVINITAAYFTREGDSINQKAVNLHMMEDVFGWIIVLIGALVIKITKLSIIDPILSVCLSLYIMYNATTNIMDAITIFLEKAPSNIKINDIKHQLLKINGINDIHHLHIWRLNETITCATLHIVVDDQISNFYCEKIKKDVREEFLKHHISHITIELETESEPCENFVCNINSHNKHRHHRHHHHHTHHHQ